MSDPLPLTPTDRTTVRRKRERGSYDRALIDSVLDEGLICHVAFMADHGPVVLPMAYARRGDHLYVHGAAGNAMLRRLVSGAPACVTVTLVDGIVFARSAFHHSMNYRSVVLFGSAERVTDAQEMHDASVALLEHLARGRSGDTRLPTAEELRSTLMARFPISEASAKVRTGGPIDDEEDMDLGHWAGVLPLRTVAGVPEDDTASRSPAPAYIEGHRLRGGTLAPTPDV